MNWRQLLISVALILLSVGCATHADDVDYGLNHYEMGVYGLAIPKLLSGVPALEKEQPTDERVTRGYLALGVMAQSEQQYVEAEMYMKKALTTATNAASHTNMHLRNAHNTLGNFYLAQENYEAAISQLEGALAISESQNLEPILRAIDTDNTAVAYAELGQLDKALMLSKRALLLTEQAADSQDYLVTKGIALFNQANAYEKLAQFDLALKNYDASIEVLSLLANSKPYESWRLDIVKGRKEKLMATLGKYDET